MKNLPTFEEFVNEARVYGMFNDSQGKPSKLSQEILDICLKGLPKYVIDKKIKATFLISETILISNCNSLQLARNVRRLSIKP